jgi:hypothetical protein
MKFTLHDFYDTPLPQRNSHKISIIYKSVENPMNQKSLQIVLCVHLQQTSATHRRMEHLPFAAKESRITLN